MSDHVNIHQAKTMLSKLLQRVEQGEEIVIARAGRPVARLVPLEGARSARRLGLYAGQVRIAEGFDELPEDIAAAFEGTEE